MKSNEKAGNAADLARLLENMTKRQTTLATRVELVEAIGEAEEAQGGARFRSIKLASRELSDDLFDQGAALEALGNMLRDIIPGMNEALA